jgi:uncharacterized protein YceK
LRVDREPCDEATIVFVDRRVTVTLAVLLLVAGCSSAPGSARTSPGATARETGATAAPSAAGVSASAAGPATAVPVTAAPAPTAVPTPTAAPTAPSVDALWAAVASAIDRRGHLRIRVIGPSPGELRYEPAASATVASGQLTFVCVGGKAYDGQSSFEPVPGSWECGTKALVHGFRGAGLPLDAWNDSLPPDSEIRESVKVLEDGTWRWSYSGLNPVFGGQIRATVVVDAATGEIRSASRQDPTGATTYGISYAETFPKIVRP